MKKNPAKKPASPKAPVPDSPQIPERALNEAGIDAKETFLESIPESQRWNPVPGSAGRQAPETPSEEENDEGQNQSAQLVEKGVAEAEDDHSRQAAARASRQSKLQP